MKISKYQKEILEILNKEKDAYILVYSTRLDVRCVLYAKLDKVIRFDTFAKFAMNGLIKKLPGKLSFGDWEGKWVLK